MKFIALIIVAFTFLAIIRKYEIRLTFLLGGLALFLLSGHPELWTGKFIEILSNSKIISVVLPVIGFVTVIEYCGCIHYLVEFLAYPFSKLGPFKILAVTLITFVVSAALISASASGPAVGIVMLPLAISTGLDPLLAICAILAGTWGGILNPGSQHAVILSEIASVPATEVISHMAPAVVAGVIVTSIALFIQSKFHKSEDVLEIKIQETSETTDRKKSNRFIQAMLPILPMPLLLFFHFPVFPVMMACIALTMILNWQKGFNNLGNVFFDGVGKAYASIVCIIVAVIVFIAGLDAAIDLKNTLIDFLKTSGMGVQYFGVLLTFLFSIFTGSGDAIVQAFNLSITAHAAEFNYSSLNMGCLIWIAGEMGRCLSPIAPVTLILSTMAGVSPFVLIKKLIVPIVLGLLTCFILLG